MLLSTSPSPLFKTKEVVPDEMPEEEQSDPTLSWAVQLLGELLGELFGELFGELCRSRGTLQRSQ